MKKLHYKLFGILVIIILLLITYVHAIESIEVQETNINDIIHTEDEIQIDIKNIKIINDQLRMNIDIKSNGDVVELLEIPTVDNDTVNVNDTSNNTLGIEIRNSNLKTKKEALLSIKSLVIKKILIIHE